MLEMEGPSTSGKHSQGMSSAIDRLVLRHQLVAAPADAHSPCSWRTAAEHIIYVAGITSGCDDERPRAFVRKGAISALYSRSARLMTQNHSSEIALLHTIAGTTM